MRHHRILPAVIVCFLFSVFTPFFLSAQEVNFKRGDVNQDGVLDLSDPVSLLLYLFSSGSITCEKAADMNDSGALDIADAVYGLQYLFAGGTEPPAPFLGCGTDPTEDELTCMESRCGTFPGSIIFSEIMASNAESIVDENGDNSDWIELYMDSAAEDPEIDLEGWYLTDNAGNLTKWRFPRVVMERGDYLLVFASGKDRAVEGAELHTGFQLDAEGEYLALVAPDGATVVAEFTPGYPEQLTDISYGRAQWTTTYVEKDALCRFLVPTASDAADEDAWTSRDFNDADWDLGQAGFGFSAIAQEGFEVTYIKANVTVDHLTTAEDVATDPSKQTTVVTETASVVDFFNSGGSGNYSNDNAFPGIGYTDIEDFVVVVSGTVLIPEPGYWSFGVNSDDGFRFELTNGSSTFSMEHASPRGSSDTIEVFNITEAGPYDISLLYYERGGGAELELFAAQGNYPSFNYNQFDLVGDTANGGLGLVGFAGSFTTDVGGGMRNENASFWMRKTFIIEDRNALGALFLRMKYEDGFVAYINGVEVERQNAPAAMHWNSSATSDRAIEDAAVQEEFNLTDFLYVLENGTNVLAVHGLNDAASNGNFLIQPVLIAAGKDAQLQYMETATPGSFNVSGKADFVKRIVSSVPRGFYDDDFELSLSTETEGAQIRYTTNGAAPTVSYGTVYSGPITIDGTTVLRAAAFKDGFIDSKVMTNSYFFVDDVLQQSPSGQRPGPEWPSGSVNGQILDYGMDPAIVNDPVWGTQVRDAFLDISTISIVTDIENLFGSAAGIYVNPRNDGRAWERPVSAELIHPDGAEGFGVDAGLRIRGAFSRSTNNPKHSLRLFFRKAYGPGKLDYPLFDWEGAEEFDKVDLRTSQNYSWAYGGDGKNTMLREVFSRDVQREMGQSYTRSRYYHVYLNGHYWGLYQTQERADADYAESYLGGDADYYDVIKNDSSGNRALQATDGNMDAYRRLYDDAVDGFSGDSAYFRVQGLTSDGSPDPFGERLLDPQNLMDYMICTYYTGDPDAPISCWAHFSNNVFAIYNRFEPEGFTWYRHDAEHSLGTSGGLYEDRLLTDATDRSIGQYWADFNPSWLHLRLTQHEEYLLEFADRVNGYFFHGGVLSPQANIERWLERAGQIDLAIIAESARWGDAKRSTPLDKDDWQAQVDYMAGTYFPQRTQIVLDQMRSVNMFPDEAIVSFSRHGGDVEPGFQLRMSQNNGTPGTIYYTLNGSDPRRWGGAINPSAAVFEDDTTAVTLVSSGSVWRYHDQGDNLGTAWRGAGYADGGWLSGEAELGYGDGTEQTEVGYGLDPDDKYITTYFRHEFSVEDPASFTEVTLSIVCDDGAVVYLNGVEALRVNMPVGTITYTTLADGVNVPVGGDDESRFVSYDVPSSLLVEGTNLLAVEIHQGSADSSDISFDLELTALAAGEGSPAIEINNSVTVMARVYRNGNWGAMTRARFMVGMDGLVINEVMASNHTTLEDPDEPGEFPDWIELYNSTAETIDLSGMYLSDSRQEPAKWRISDGIVIESGDHLLFYVDDDGTQGPFHTSYKLSINGEELFLVDIDGTTVIDTIQFGMQQSNVAYGRYPDGGDTWGFHTSATPGWPNDPHDD